MTTPAPPVDLPSNLRHHEHEHQQQRIHRWRCCPSRSRRQSPQPRKARRPRWPRRRWQPQRRRGHDCCRNREPSGALSEPSAPPAPTPAARRRGRGRGSRVGVQAAAPAATAAAMPGDACASCELCTLKRRVAVLEGDLVAARTAAAVPPPPAISKVAMLPLRDAAVTALMHDAVMAQAPHLIPEHFHVLQHDSNVPVVKRFLAGVSKATQGQLTTVEDVLRCGMRTIVPAQKDTHGVSRPDAVAHFIGFHGTKSVEALRDILTNGFNPSRRRGQALGRGEYFGRDPTIAAGYDTLQCITVNLLLHVPAVITNRADTSQIVVMDNPTDRSETFCLPIGLYGLQAEVYTAEAEKWRPESLLSEQARIHKAEQAAMAKAAAAAARALRQPVVAARTKSTVTDCSDSLVSLGTVAVKQTQTTTTTRCLASWISSKAARCSRLVNRRWRLKQPSMKLVMSLASTPSLKTGTCRSRQKLRPAPNYHSPPSATMTRTCSTIARVVPPTAMKTMSSKCNPAAHVRWVLPMMTMKVHSRRSRRRRV
jgi:hypothetical protein